MPKWEVSLSDGRTMLVHSLTELSNDQIQQAAIGGESQPAASPFSSGGAKFLGKMGGAVAADMAFGAPLTEAGAAIGTAIAPGIGTAIGGGLGAGVSSFLGALAGDRIRQRLADRATGETTPFSQSVKEAAPFGAFGVGEKAVGAGLEAAAPFLKNAPRVLKMFTRSGTIANRAAESAGGAFAAGTVGGLAQGESVPSALKEGMSQAPIGGVIGGALQAVPSFLRTRRGTDVKTAGSAVVTEADRLVQSQRTGNLPKYLVERGHEIWQKVEQPIVADPAPIPLKEFYETAVRQYGEEAPQVESLLKAFGEKGLPGETSAVSTSELSRLGITSEELQQLSHAHPGQIDIALSGRGSREMTFERPVAPQEALDVASRVSGKVTGGAKAGFKRGFTYQDSVNSDVRSVIYDTLKSRLDTPSQQAVNAALKEYGEFATLRNRAIATLSPFGNPKTPTKPGVAFLTRVASGEQTASTPDDQRLISFLKEATGNDPSAGLEELVQTLANAKSQHQAARLIQSWVTRIGIAYPVIRAIFRPK